MRYSFSRLELAGSLGDLGVILPLAVGMIMINGVNPQGLFLAMGLYYVASGVYFGVTTPVEPMKVIGSYAVAKALPAAMVYASGLWMGILLLGIGLSGAMDKLVKYIPKPTIRGVQLTTGTLLMAEGARLILGFSKFQVRHGAAEPFMAVQSLLFVPMNWILGLATLAATLLLLHNRRFPAGLVVVVCGLVVGLLLGSGAQRLSLGLSLPSLLPAGFPETASLWTALLTLSLPQLPMTLGNAVISNSDLAKEYFGNEASRTTNKALCISMGIANLGGFLLGGMPMCHGAGGLAAHYRFGARTAGSNVFIGTVFVVLALLFGDSVLAAAQLLPMSVLGVLLLFSGSQLAIMILDVKERNDLFVTLFVLGVATASNLALGFAVGIGLFYLLKNPRFSL